MPDGEEMTGTPDGEPPEMPDGELPGMPNGEEMDGMPDGEGPEKPGWQSADDTGERPDRFAQGTLRQTDGGGYRGERNGIAEKETPPVSGGAALIGISVLALLAGVLIAVKHR